MNARGQYGQRYTAIAGPFFHTVGDRDKLTDETDTFLGTDVIRGRRALPAGGR